MARPKKNNAEYFSHDADMRNDVKIKALRRNFSHTGYAVWNYLLETLTDSDFFEIEWEDINVELLAADYDVAVDELNAIVEYCLKIGLLQKQGNKLYSETHKKRFSPLLANRERKRIMCDKNTVETPENGVTARRNSAKTTKESKSGETKPHSKGKESIGDNIPPPKISRKEQQQAAEGRRKEFYNHLAQFVAKYGKEMIRAFYDYWGELNKSKTKMRWELQDTWELERRLSKWANNDNSFKTNEKTTEQKPFVHRID